MDAASVLPCLALDVREGHNVLDLCAAPGGKTLALLQSNAIGERSCLICLFSSLIYAVVVGNPPSSIIYTTGFLCVNDSSVSRTLRLKRVLHSYIPKQFLTDEKLCITSFDGTKWGEIERNTFDRVRFSYFEPESIAFAWSNNPDAKTVFAPCFLSRVQVLVDVPCTTDRHSVMENDNSIFNKSRTGERRRLPQLQLELLM